MKFSIRELFLVTLAIGCILALFAKDQSLIPKPKYIGGTCVIYTDQAGSEFLGIVQAAKYWHPGGPDHWDYRVDYITDDDDIQTVWLVMESELRTTPTTRDEWFVAMDRVSAKQNARWLSSPPEPQTVYFSGNYPRGHAMREARP